MPSVHSGRGMGSEFGFLRGSDRPDYHFQFCPRNSAGTKQRRLCLGKREHGGFDADLTGSAVEYEVYGGAQTAADVVGAGRREFGKAVSARRGDWNAGSTDQGLD